MYMLLSDIQCQVYSEMLWKTSLCPSPEVWQVRQGCYRELVFWDVFGLYISLFSLCPMHCIVFQFTTISNTYSYRYLQQLSSLFLKVRQEDENTFLYFQVESGEFSAPLKSFKRKLYINLVTNFHENFTFCFNFDEILEFLKWTMHTFNTSYSRSIDYRV